MESIVFQYSSPYLRQSNDPPRRIFLRNFLHPYVSALVRMYSVEDREWVCAIWRSRLTVAGMTNQNNAPELIDLSKIMSLTGLGRTATYALTKRGDFPEPYRFGRKVIRWNLVEVHEWISSCKGIQISPTARKVRNSKKGAPKKISVAGVGFRRNSVGGDE